MLTGAIDLLPWALAAPLVGVIALLIVGGRLSGRACGVVATTAVGVSFLLALAITAEFVRPAEAAAATRSAAAAERDGEDHSGTAEDGGHAQGRSHEIVLWRWIHATEPLADDDLVTIYVAARPLPRGEPIEADMIAELRVPAGSRAGNRTVREELPLMWDPEALIGTVPILEPVPEGAILSSRIVPSLGRDDRRFVPAQEEGPGFRADIRLRLDGLSLLMLLLVTGVGFLIHLFSAGYMAHDPEQRRYFTYLNLFVFSMLTLVLAADFLVLFVGWELVGACSYLLIGFWHSESANAAAGRKAFIVNRVGDLAFLIGMMLIWTTFGSLAFSDVLPASAAGVAAGGAAIAIPLLLLIGATGKSAQLPLYVWLPDAMAGPTPVSALIHAATMVTAGVYMIARAHVLFEAAPVVMAGVAVIGAATALLAASIALVQNDIKRVLAYSTISQLGYMFMAVGAGAYVAGVFHLTTHAFFKALLFLAAGSVMHAMEHGFDHAGTGSRPPDSDGVPAHQDMRLMGGLLRRAPVTGWTFLIGGLALSGVFPLAGFWSKDEILLETFARGAGVAGSQWLWNALYATGLFTALLTAIYTGRQLVMVLFGQPRSDGARNASESEARMTVPLVVLAVLSAAGGLLVLDVFGAPLPALLEPVLGGHHAESAPTLVLAAVALGIALAGLALAARLWREGGAEGNAEGAGETPGLPGGLRALLANGWYVDDLYAAMFVRPFDRIARGLWRRVDDGLIDAAVNAIGRGVLTAGQRARPLQAGFVRGYGLSVLVGTACLALYLAWRVASP